MWLMSMNSGKVYRKSCGIFLRLMVCFCVFVIFITCFTINASADSYSVTYNVQSVDPWAGFGSLFNYDYEYTQTTYNYAPNFQRFQSTDNIASGSHWLQINLVTSQSTPIKDGYWNKFVTWVFIRTNVVSIGATPFGKITLTYGTSTDDMKTQTIEGTVTGKKITSGSFTGFEIEFEFTNRTGGDLTYMQLDLGTKLPNAYQRQFDLGYQLGSWLSASSMSEAPIYSSPDMSDLDDYYDAESELMGEISGGIGMGRDQINDSANYVDLYSNGFAFWQVMFNEIFVFSQPINALISISAGIGLIAFLLNLVGYFRRHKE